MIKEKISKWQLRYAKLCAWWLGFKLCNGKLYTNRIEYLKAKEEKVKT